MAELKGKSAAQILHSGEMDIDGMEEILALYRDLLPLADEALKVKGKTRMPGTEEARMRLEEGFTLLEPSELLPSAKALSKRTSEILDVLENYSEKKDAVRQIKGIMADGAKVEELVRTYLEKGDEELREELAASDLDPEVILFVIFNAMKGVFTERARMLEQVEAEGWEQGTCPVCGGLPAVAMMTGEGGQRYLVCHRCERRWRFARVLCPFCGNKDHEKLGYFTIEGDDQRVRVDFCRVCQGYLKTWDVRETEDARPEVEDLMTARFDLAAENEGYRRGAPNIFGIWVGFDEGEEPDA